jgi:hypothetical protein
MFGKIALAGGTCDLDLFYTQIVLPHIITIHLPH